MVGGIYKDVEPTVLGRGKEKAAHHEGGRPNVFVAEAMAQCLLAETNLLLLHASFRLALLFDGGLRGGEAGDGDAIRTA